MGHCFKAGLLATTTEKGSEAGIAAALEAAERHVGHALERERMHLNAARTWLSRDFAGAAKLYGDICAEYPRDLLALQIAHLFDFFLGHSSMLRDRPAQVLHAWGERDPQRGIVLGMHSFGLEECGAYDDAEAIGRRAIELSPADVWAVARGHSRAGNARPDAFGHRVDQEHGSRPGANTTSSPSTTGGTWRSFISTWRTTMRRWRCTTRACGPLPRGSREK